MESLKLKAAERRHKMAGKFEQEPSTFEYVRESPLRSSYMVDHLGATTSSWLTLAPSEPQRPVWIGLARIGLDEMGKKESNYLDVASAANRKGPIKATRMVWLRYKFISQQ